MERVTRPLVPEDVEAVAALECLVFPQEAWSPALLLEELGSPWSHYLGVFEGSALIAYGGIKGEQEGDLMTLAVAPSYRRQGIGEKLTKDLIASARAAGIKQLFLEVRRSNTVAQRLYAGLGFRTIHVIPDYYPSPTEDALLMFCDLSGFPKPDVA